MHGLENYSTLGKDPETKLRTYQKQSRRILSELYCKRTKMKMRETWPHRRDPVNTFCLLWSFGIFV